MNFVKTVTSDAICTNTGPSTSAESVLKTRNCDLECSPVHPTSYRGGPWSLTECLSLCRVRTVLDRIWPALYVWIVWTPIVLYKGPHSRLHICRDQAAYKCRHSYFATLRWLVEFCADGHDLDCSHELSRCHFSVEIITATGSDHVASNTGMQYMSRPDQCIVIRSLYTRPSKMHRLRNASILSHFFTPFIVDRPVWYLFTSRHLTDRRQIVATCIENELVHCRQRIYAKRLYY